MLVLNTGGELNMTMDVKLVFKDRESYLLEEIISINIFPKCIVLMSEVGGTVQYKLTEVVAWFCTPHKNYND